MEPQDILPQQEAAFDFFNPPDELDYTQALEATAQMPEFDLASPPDELDYAQALKLARVYKNAPRSDETQEHSISSLPGKIGKLRAPKEQPIKGILTQGFDTKVDYTKSGRHGGLDIAAPVGTPIPSTVGGTVVGVEDQGKRDYGKMVLVKGEDGVTRRYGHLSAFSVKSGQKIKPGEVLGLVGSTGRSTGPHLHYEEIEL